MGVADATTPATLADARLTAADGARLLALADGLCRVGRLRDGRDAGQFSVFNFRLRAAYEPSRGGRPPAMVVLMRAGMFRRHTWWARAHWPVPGRPMRLEVPKPIDRGWSWPLDVDEIRKRLTKESVWREAVGASWEARVAEVEGWLAAAVVAPFERG